MACISKLANAIAYDCDSGATGLVSAIIINKADIASYTVDTYGKVSSLSLVSGAKAYKIDTVKRSLVLSTTLKVNDGAPNAFTHSATLTYTGIDSDEVFTSISRALSNGSFVILARRVAGNVNVRGLYYGMSATAFDQNSHENGAWSTMTMETPDNVIGEDNLTMPKATYDALYAAAVG
nr:MAG: hypothetical protein [Bacteriophage sp.]